MAKAAVLLPRQEMQQMAADLIAQYPNLSPFCIEYTYTDAACQRAIRLQNDGCELILARGLQAALIQRAVPLPVIAITATAQEVGVLAARCKRELGLPNPKIGLIAFENMLGDTSRFDELFGVELCRYTLPDTQETDTYASLAALVDRALQEGCQAVVGGDVVCARAETLGLPHYFLASGQESLQNAFAIADRVAYAIDLEKRARAEMNTMLDFTFSGILQIDAEGVVRRGNRVLYNILDKHPEELIGRPVQEALPQLRGEMLDKALHRGEEAYAILLPIEGHTVVVNIAPIRLENQIRGAILTFQEGRRITEISGELRRELYRRGFVAQCRFDRLPVQDAATKEILERARQIAQYPVPVLLTGEVGTGKRQLAQCLHNESPNRANAFVELDCSAYQPDSLDTLLFGSYSTRADAPACLAEAAQNGTLYLAHIEALSPELQFKILQLIGGKIWRNGASQPAQAAVRVVASSNADLPALLQEGLFRSDLYYALNVLSLALPPLRARRADILPWADRYLSEAQEQYKRYVSLTNGAREFLQKYDWPGNLDQLHSVCERTVLLAPRRSVDEVFLRAQLRELTPAAPALPGATVVPQPGTDPRAARIRQALQATGGDRQQAADALGISKTTLWRQMKKMDITFTK